MKCNSNEYALINQREFETQSNLTCLILLDSKDTKTLQNHSSYNKKNSEAFHVPQNHDLSTSWCSKDLLNLLKKSIKMKYPKYCVYTLFNHCQSFVCSYFRIVVYLFQGKGVEWEKNTKWSYSLSSSNKNQLT